MFLPKLLSILILSKYCVGEVTLTKSKVVIDITTKECLKCRLQNCIHIQAFEMCSDNDYTNPCQPNYLNDCKYYIPNDDTIFLIDNKDFHIFYNKETKWSCDTCMGKCMK